MEVGSLGVGATGAGAGNIIATGDLTASTVIATDAIQVYSTISIQSTSGAIYLATIGNSLSNCPNIFPNQTATGKWIIGLQGMTDVSGEPIIQIQDLSGAYPINFVSAGAGLASIKTSPVPSQAPATALALGTVWQNTAAWDVTLLVSLAITANTSLVVSLGVGSSTPPAVTSLISGTTATGLLVVPIRVPAGYYALLETSGTGTIAIVGQVLENS